MAASERPRSALDWNVEVEHLLTHAQIFVECDGRIVAMIGLDIDHPGAASGGNAAQPLDQCGGTAAPAMRFGDREIVNIDFAPGLLELVELIGDKAADHLIAG